MAWVRNGLVNIYYEWIHSENSQAEEGIVLIHGVGLDMYSWDFIIPYLRKDYHIIRYDLRGHGESDPGEEKRTIDLFYRDLLFLLSELNIHSYHLVGHGFGGFVGIQLAAQKEQGLKTLTLMGVPIHFPKQLGDQVVKERKESLQEENSLMPMAKDLVKKICYPPTAEKEKILLNAYRKVSPDVYFDIFHTDDLRVSAKRLQQIDVPILILSGSEDKIYPPALFCASLNFNPCARYYSVPHASFMLQMDQPKVTAEWMTDFIDKNRNGFLPDSDYQKHLTSQMYSEIRGLLNQEESSQSVNELQVNLMNGFYVQMNGKTILEGWGKRKAKPILVYLVFQKSVTRDQLCDLFWPEVDLDNARNRLRVSIHYLKKLLEKDANKNAPPMLVTDREHVFLQGNIQSDLVNHITRIKMGNQIKDQVEKAEHYKTLLMERSENNLPGLYEEWFLDLQNWLEKEYAEMSLLLAEFYKKQKDEQKAAYYLEVALKI